MVAYDKLMRDSVDSAGCIIRDIQQQISLGNFNAALSSVGSLNIMLANAEVYRNLYEQSKEFLESEAK